MLGKILKKIGFDLLILFLGLYLHKNTLSKKYSGKRHTSISNE